MLMFFWDVVAYFVAYFVTKAQSSFYDYFDDFTSTALDGVRGLLLSFYLHTIHHVCLG